MFNVFSPKASKTAGETAKSLVEENFITDDSSETVTATTTQETKKIISVGDSLPYGKRLHYGHPENVVRMKDIGVKRRILVLGVIGAFTPYCWNRHLFRVLQKLQYYEERYIDYICCISTNDVFTQTAWGSYLGCDETVLMLADITTEYTKAIGMDVVLPWLDNTVRSKRYIMYAEDMIVLKMEVASNDGPKLLWQCEHLLEENEDTTDSDSWDVI